MVNIATTPSSKWKGTADELDDVLAALLTESFTRDFALGESKLRPARLLEALAVRLPRPYEDPAARAPSRNLDHYIEAQVHGDVRLDEDVELLVADPSFRGTPTAGTLQQICDRYAIRLFWHAGCWLAPDEVPSDFRGPAMPPLAARIAVDGRVDAAAIGRAARSLGERPSEWAEVAGIAPLQQLKLIWHVLVRHGHTHATRSSELGRPRGGSGREFE